MTKLQSLFIVSCLILATFVPNASRSQEQNSTAKENKKMDELQVDALRNANAIPQFHRVRGVQRPKFPDNYDFEEDRRVRSLFYKLTRDESGDIWIRLIEHSNDESYALVIGDNGTDAEAWTVGRMCRYICESRLSLFDSVNSDLKSVDRPDVYIGPNESVDDLKQWWISTGQKPLHQLQIAHCKGNLERLLSNDDLPREVKEHYGKLLTDHIQEISKTGKPIMHRIGWDRFDFFIPKPESKPEEVRTK